MKPKYYARHWLELEDGGGDKWLYVRSPDGHPEVFVFVEIIALPAYCGRDANVAWVGSVDVVDLNVASSEQLESALDSCGWTELLDQVQDWHNAVLAWIEDGCAGEQPHMEPELLLSLAQVLYDYGCKAPCWSDEAAPITERNFDLYMHSSPGEENKHFQRLRAAARREAEALLDDEYRNEVLDTRIVNGIGQTAREYAQGAEGMWVALRRMAAKGDEASPEEQIMLKVFGACTHTLGGDPIPEDLRAATPTKGDHHQQGELT